MWFLYALITVIAWGGADLLYKKGADQATSSTHLRTGIAVGVVMGIHAVIYWLVHPDIEFSLGIMVQYLPISACYIVSMIVGYFGLRYLMVSVSSPIQNSSGAIVAILCLIFFSTLPTLIEGIGVIILCVGVFLLSLLEKREEDALRAAAGEIIDKKYRYGLIAFLYPIIYCIIDALGTFLDALYLDELELLTEDQALLSYEFTFLIVGIVLLLYMLLVKREKYTLKQEPWRYGAAVAETAGQFFYVYAMAGNGAVAAPMISAYCVVSLILGRIFLKEKLSKAKYLVIVLIVVGIVLLGVAEGLAE